ncbi:DnaJ-domain-containing protein [Haematococcus lacustris]
MNENGKTAYDILGLVTGPEATEAEIKKAYRTLALKLHPDKNKGNPNAATEFAQLEQAYRVLTDLQARGALDDLLRAKMQRQARRSSENDLKRKMRDELEQREKQFASSRQEEQAARSRLNEELDRLRRTMAAEAAERAAAAAAAPTACGVNPTGPSRGGGRGDSGLGGTVPCAQAGMAPGCQAHEPLAAAITCTVKVSWDASSRQYTADELRRIFSAHGSVQDVVVRESRRKSSKSSNPGRVKASALVVLASPEEVARAASSLCGDLADPLLVLPLAKVAPEVREPAPPLAAVPGPTAAPAVAALAPAPAAYPATTLFPLNPPTPAFSMQLPSSSREQQQPEPTIGSQQGQGQGHDRHRPAAPLFPTAQTNAPAVGAAAFPFAGGTASFPVAANGSFNSFPGMPRGLAGVAAAGKESAILEKMRRAAERDRLLREAAVADE